MSTQKPSASRPSGQQGPHDPHEAPPPSYAESTGQYGAMPQQHRAIIITTTSHVDPERVALLTDAVRTDRRFPLALLFFLFGWFCPPLWFFGACCCVGHPNVYEAWWGRMNLVMAMTFMISSIIYSIAVIISGRGLLLGYMQS
ncbi:hypothetical protein BC940DRAFT_320436 [Gongronella butleri]|nr:hypothetical protein BC940DRAFT_320436 [Gongronella butleri]